MPNKRVLVLGVGNVLFGDDGFGPAVAKDLADQSAFPADVLVADVGTSVREVLFDLLLSEKRPERIIIIDAVDETTRRPGDVFELPVRGIPARKTNDFSLHQFPTVCLLDELQQHGGTEIRVIATQVARIPDEVGPGLSEPVRRAVREASMLVRQLTGETGE